jgi:ABC-2 type transport system permease protein
MSKYAVILGKNLRTAWSFPIWIIVSLMQPIFWVLMYGVLMNSLEVNYGNGVLSYMTYFSTGIIAATAVFSALWSGITILHDLQNGIINRLLWSGCSKFSIVGAYVSQALVSILFQCVVILWLVIYMGADLSLNFKNIVLTGLVVLLLGAALTALSHFISLLLRKQDAVISLVNFITLPLFFISGILFPIGSVPSWFKTIAFLNPAQHGAEIIRAILLKDYSNYAYLNESILYLAGFSIVFFLLSLPLVKIER